MNGAFLRKCRAAPAVVRAAYEGSAEPIVEPGMPDEAPHSFDHAAPAAPDAQALEAVRPDGREQGLRAASRFLVVVAAAAAGAYAYAEVRGGVGMPAMKQVVLALAASLFLAWLTWWLAEDAADRSRAAAAADHQGTRARPADLDGTTEPGDADPAAGGAGSTPPTAVETGSVAAGHPGAEAPSEPPPVRPG